MKIPLASLPCTSSRFTGGCLWSVLFLFLGNGHLRAEIPESNLAYPVLIESEDGNTGSGFFLEAGRQVYLVTASHVLCSPLSGQIIGSQARLTSSIPGSDTRLLRIELDLHRLQQDKRVRVHHARDAMLIHIGKMNGEGDTAPIKYLPGVRIPRNGMIVVVAGRNTRLGEGVRVSGEVFVLGYPKSVGISQIEQVNFRTPLVRRGIVAGKNPRKGSIILDCQVDGGNSGGPVIQVSRGTGGEERYDVVGFVTEFVPTAEEWINRSHGQVKVNLSNSGYSVMVPMDPIWEMIEMERISLTQKRSLP